MGYNQHVPIYLSIVLQFTISNSNKIVSSNPVHGEMYSIQHDMIKFVIDKSVIFSGLLPFPPPIRLTATI